ncbi:MAG: methyltransferase domain-containing protein [Spirochaetaceae bacterium]|nr:methyltransferase domain-containing protein [Spirochaetaceae bacterium]
MSNQCWQPERYRRCASYVPELGRGLIELLDPVRGDRILDLGCGDGELTMGLAARGCRVIGVDRSAAFVAAARRRGVAARVVDARRLAQAGLAAGSFDGVFSNAVLHWILEPAPVIAGVRRLLRAGGCFVAELGGAGNIATVHDALRAACRRRGLDPAVRDPWYFPTAQSYRALLEGGGFAVTSIRLFERPTPIPGTLAEWLDLFAGAWRAGLDRCTWNEIAAEVSASAAPLLRDAADAWTVDYVRLRVRAVAV